MKNVIKHGVDVIKQIHTQVREMARPKQKTYTEIKVDVQKLHAAAEIKNRIDTLETELKALYSKYDPMKLEILASLPGNKVDKVEAMVEGVRISKFSQIKGFGNLDQSRAMMLAKSKKLLSKVTEKVTVVNEDKLIESVLDGVITQEEYAACLTEGNIAQVLRIEKKANLEIVEKDVV